MESSEISEITGLILAGGQSSRYNGDKTFTVFRDKTFIENIIQKIRPSVSEIIISVNSLQKQSEIETLLAENRELQNTKIHYVIDTHERCNSGPVDAYLSSIQKITTPFLLCVPIDMPGITSLSIEMLVNELRKYPVDIATYSIKNENLTSLFHAAKTQAMRNIVEIWTEKIHCRISTLYRLAASIRVIVVETEGPLVNVNRSDDVELLTNAAQDIIITNRQTITSGYKPYLEYLGHTERVGIDIQLQLLQQELEHWEISIIRNHIKKDIASIKKKL